VQEGIFHADTDPEPVFLGKKFREFGEKAVGIVCFLKNYRVLHMETLLNCYIHIVSEENLWLAWKLFRRGKRKRADVRAFERRLEDKLLSLRRELANETYRHGSYRRFVVHDPKRRMISAPQIRDQVVHQAIWNVLFPHFDRRFSAAVHSCRPGRGTQSAVLKIAKTARRLSGRGKVWILHLDVVKFFDSVDHAALRGNLRRAISCPRTLKLLDGIIDGYNSDLPIGRGIPLGNLTSQLFCNVMLMSVDRWMDGGNFAGSYARYADDLFVLGNDRSSLNGLSREIIDKLLSLGLRCRFRVVRYHGFEALGKRFFYDGMAIRRSTRVNAVFKLKTALLAYASGAISANWLDSVAASLNGLSRPVSDPRWTKKLGKDILTI
jgi:retron-type reverse transcriptase